jgi:hypothetical protein
MNALGSQGRRASLIALVAAWLPALLLLTVAAHHVVRVRQDGLTPWKGGGFGMFSTIDSQSHRRVRVFATTFDGRTMALEPGDEFEYDLRRARFLPKSWQVAQLATRLAKSEWTIQRSPDGAPVLRPIHARQPNVEAVRVERVRVEISGLAFDRRTRALTSPSLGHAESKNEAP